MRKRTPAHRLDAWSYKVASPQLLSVFYGINQEGDIKSVYAERESGAVYLSTAPSGRQLVHPLNRSNLRSEVIVAYNLTDVFEVPAPLIGDDSVSSQLQALKLKAAAKKDETSKLRR
jgi:hypothetical protein